MSKPSAMDANPDTTNLGRPDGGPNGRRLVVLFASTSALVCGFLVLKWHLIPSPFVHTKTALGLGLLAIAATGLIMARSLRIPARKAAVATMLPLLFLAWHSWVAPWGYEMERTALTLPLPEGYTTTYTRHDDDIPICDFSCPYARIRGYYPPVDNVSQFVQDFVQHSLVEMEEDGWHLVSMREYSRTADRPITTCTTHCRLNWHKEGIWAYVSIGEGELGGNFTRPVGTIPLQIFLEG